MRRTASRTYPPGPEGAPPGRPFLPFTRDPLGLLTRVAREHDDVVYFGGVLMTPDRREVSYSPSAEEQD